MAVNISATRDAVASMLANLVGRVELAATGDLSFPFESTRIFINVRQFGDSSAVVNVFAITNVDLEPSPQLYEFVATHSGDWVMGHLALDVTDGRGTLVLRHTLLADYLDEPELSNAVRAIAFTADEIDNELKAKFGGRLASEV
jgi:type III secretion system-like peptide-binding chaperone